MSDNFVEGYAISKAYKGRDPHINSFGSNKQFWVFWLKTKRYYF